MEFALQKTLDASDVKMIRKKMKMKQKELAELMNVSVKTVEHWESSGGSVSGAAAALLCIFSAGSTGRDCSGLFPAFRYSFTVIPNFSINIRFKYLLLEKPVSIHISRILRSESRTYPSALSKRILFRYS